MKSLSSATPYLVSLPPLPLYSPAVAENSGGNCPPIYFSSEKYETWERFVQHPDFSVATLQYKQLFQEIDQFIAQHCVNSQPLRMAFSHFFAEIETRILTTYEPLLYSKGKIAFKLLCTLFHHNLISVEKKTDALYQLAEVINKSIELLLEHLYKVTQALQYTTGIDGEIIRARDQLIKQFAVAFSKKIYEDEKALLYANTYLDVMGPTYHPPLLTHHTKTLPTINVKTLQYCQQYVKHHLTIDAIVSYLADIYHAELRNTLTMMSKVGLSYEEINTCLAALKNRLPLYETIPNDALIQESLGRYYIRKQTTLIKIAFLKIPLLCNILQSNIQVFCQYPLSLIADEVSPYDKQDLVYIYRAGTIYWVNIGYESTHLLLTFTHLKPLISDPTLPVELIKEALHNSSKQALQEMLPEWITHPVFFPAYISFTFHGQEKIAVNTILIFFSQWYSEKEKLPLLISTLQHLQLSSQFIAKLINTFPYLTIIKLLAKTLELLCPHYSFQLIHSEMMLNHLLDVGFAVTLEDEDSNTLLIKAAGQGWESAVKNLLQKGAVINTSNLKQQTALMQAALHGHINVVDQLCTAGADLAWVDYTGRNAFMYAVIGKHPLIVEHLLTFRTSLLNHAAFPINPAFDINARDQEGKTALLSLFASIASPDVKLEPIPLNADTTHTIQKIARLLLQQGADIHACTHAGNSILTYDAIYSSGCFNLLWAAGARAHGKDSFTILCNAIRNNQLSALLIFMQAGVPVCKPIDWETGNCPISKALAWERWEIALLLLAYGQHTLTHFLRANLLSLITEKLADQRIPSQHIHPLIYRTLDPADIAFPDPQANTFFDAYIDYLNTATPNKTAMIENIMPIHLTQQLYILSQYVDMLVPLKEGDNFLLHLIKNKRYHQHWLPVIRFLILYTPLATIKDREGLTPFMYATQQGLPLIPALFSKNAPAKLTIPWTGDPFKFMLMEKELS
jgi:ankyrin repeat protein